MSTTTEEVKKLKYRPLGNTGCKVSELCLGCMTFGSDKPWYGIPATTEENSFPIINRFVELGGNFFDTANVYCHGRSEEILGTWLEASKKRDKYVVATKCGGETSSDVNDNGLSRRNIIAAVDASLERLKTHYIDLYQMHLYDFGVDQKEVLTTLNDLVRCGKVRYTGCSNFTGAQLQRALLLSEYMGLELYSTIQPQYSLLCREIEYEIIPVCKDNNIGILPWSPLKGGWLSGKYKKGQIPNDGRVGWAENIGWTQTNFSRWDNEKTWNVLDKVKEIADSLNATMSQVSLRWLLEKDYITSPIIGARTIEQLDDNLNSAFISLNPEQVALLDNVSHVDLPYPYDLQKLRLTSLNKKK